MSSLNQALRAALDHRQDLLAELHSQGTDCYRLFHGSQEGAGGLTIDRYGPQLMVQSFHQSLEREDLLHLHAMVNNRLGRGNPARAQRDRSRGNSRIDRKTPSDRADEAALSDLVGHEWGLNYRVRGRHAGQDPLLFLDLRNTRGWVKDHSKNKSVLNLFAYTCGVGLSAAAGGAREVCATWTSPKVTWRSVVKTACSTRSCRPWSSSSPTTSRPFANSPDCPSASVAGKLPSYQRLEQRQYDLVLP